MDGGSDDLGAGTSATTSYVRVLSSGSDIDPFPNGKLAVFPATATSQTITMVYRVNANTGSFRNRRIHAFNL